MEKKFSPLLQAALAAPARATLRNARLPTLLPPWRRDALVLTIYTQQREITVRATASLPLSHGYPGSSSVTSWVSWRRLRHSCMGTTFA